MDDILDEIRDLLLGMEAVHARLQHIWRYADRITGEVKKPNKRYTLYPDIVGRQQANLEENLIGRCYLDYTKKEKEALQFAKDAGTQFNKNLKKIEKEAK